MAYPEDEEKEGVVTDDIGGTPQYSPETIAGPVPEKPPMLTKTQPMTLGGAFYATQEARGGIGFKPQETFGTKPVVDLSEKTAQRIISATPIPMVAPTATTEEPTGGTETRSLGEINRSIENIARTGGAVVPETTPAPTPAPGKREYYGSETPAGRGQGAFGGFPSASTAGIVPTGGPGAGESWLDFTERMFVAPERAKAERAEQAEKELQMEKLAGLGQYGEQRIKERIRSLEPYLSKIPRKQRGEISAKLVSGIISDIDETRKAYMTGTLSSEATKGAAATTAASRLAASRSTALAKMQSDAQKYGIDLAKLGLAEKKLGLQAGQLKNQTGELQLKMQEYGQKYGVIEPWKLKIQAAKTSQDRQKLQFDMMKDLAEGYRKTRLEAWKAKYAMGGAESDTAQAEALQIADEFIGMDQLSDLFGSKQKKE